MVDSFTYFVVRVQGSDNAHFPGAWCDLVERLVTGQKQSFASGKELLELVVRNRVRPVTEIYPLEQVNQAHERLREQKVRLRAVLPPN